MATPSTFRSTMRRIQPPSAWIVIRVSNNDFLAALNRLVFKLFTSSGRRGW